MTETINTENLDTRDIYSVSEINQELKHLIGDSFPLLWVEGEISNLARPASGHIYFSLKDKNAQIRCVMFRTSQRSVDFDIDNGIQVIIRAKASLYEPRGDLQLIADKMEQAGFGALQRQFELLKKKLSKEGLFAEQHKKKIPSFPKEIAIITSPSGAAINDYLHVLQRRYPVANIKLYCTPVQGDQAAATISSAIRTVNMSTNADVIVLIRGGGSIEDLWAFNDEQLARTIHASQIPVVTGIGHEIDFTIADFVADLRAPTPSIAAELTTPDTLTLHPYVVNLQTRMVRTFKEQLNTRMQNADWLLQRLQRNHPSSTVIKQQKELCAQLQRLLTHTKINTATKRNQIAMLATQLYAHSPSKTLDHAYTQSNFISNRLLASMQQYLELKKHQFQLLTTTIHAISPLNTLDRGYSITVKVKPRTKIISNYDQTRAGDQLVTYLATGQVVSRVESTSSASALIDHRQAAKKPD